MVTTIDNSVKGQELKKKIVFSLDSPNTSVEWPSISSTDQDAILDLLCSLLAPIGQYRILYTQPSKGKRSRKRKRAPPTDPSTPPEPAPLPPPPPELASFLTIGLNSTTRHLESMAASTVAAVPTEKALQKSRLLAIFVCRSDSQPSQLHSHLPVLCNIASRPPHEQIVRLVQLPRGAEARIAASLAIPQVGFLGLIEGAPGSSSLLSFLEAKILAVKVPWLEGPLGYQPTTVRVMKTTAPPPPKKTVVRVEKLEKPFK